MFSLFPNTVAKLGEVKEAGILTFHTCLCAKLFQSCPTLCHSMDCSPPGSSVREILQARILEWVAMPSSRLFYQMNVDMKVTRVKIAQLCPTL